MSYEDKPWTIMKWLFEMFNWDEDTKLMVFDLGALIFCSIGAIKCADWSKHSDVINGQIKVAEYEKDTKLKTAKYQAITECIKSGKNALECKAIFDNQ